MRQMVRSWIASVFIAKQGSELMPKSVVWMSDWDREAMDRKLNIC